MAVVLYIADDANETEHVSRLLLSRPNHPSQKTIQFDLIHCACLTEGIRQLRKSEIDIVLLDLSVPDSDDLQSFIKLFPAIPVIVLSNYNNEQLAVQAVKLGAQDYLVKDYIDEQLLSRSIAYAIERQRMLTDLKQHREKERHLAYHDALTGLPNRQFFFEHLHYTIAQARRRQTKLAVIFLDLDGFKNINDTYGHDVGDFVLRAIASRLSECVRESDTVARLGGDEFTIILDSITARTDANKVAEKITSAINQPIRWNNQQLQISASIGISSYPDDSQDGEWLIKMADSAMYQAKAAGKNRYQFYIRVDRSQDWYVRKMEYDLALAIKRDELQIYYQPQLDLQRGSITGLEALLRWNHPTMELILPGQFLPLAEETGLITSIGEWVFEEICRQHQDWSVTGISPLRIGINLSGREFRSKMLMDFIRSMIKNSRIRPDILMFEINEKDASQDIDYTIKMFHKLKQVGIQIGIDQYDSHGISLVDLSKMPIDSIKINKKFVQKANLESHYASATSAMAMLAHHFNCRFAAAGVETDAQLNFLKSVNCDDVQGFHVARPCPANQIHPFALPVESAINAASIRLADV